MSPQYNKLARADIGRIIERGKRVEHGGVALVYQNTKNNTPRFAIVIGLKTDKRATKRNRARRCMREAIYGYLQKNPLLFDGVFFVKQLPGKITTNTCILLTSVLFEKITENQRIKP